MTPTLTAGYGTTPPGDTEMAELVQYIGGSMTDAAAEAFEDRLLEDEGFYNRVGPYLRVWVSPKPMPFEVEIEKSLEREQAESRSRGLRLTPSLRSGRQVAPWRRRSMTVGKLLAAATVVFGVVQVGVVEYASRERPDSASTLVQVPVLRHDTLAGTQLSRPQPQTPNAVATGLAHKPAATHPKQVAVVKPTPIDPATERAVAAWAVAPLDAASARASAPVGDIPVPPVVPAPVYTPQIDSATVPGQGIEIITGPPKPTGSRWPSWLPHLPHIPHIPWPPHKLIGRR